MLLLRPRVFAEREERRQQAERDERDFQRYEADWKELKSRYSSGRADG